MYHQLPAYFSLSMLQGLENGQNRLSNGMFKLHHKGNLLSKSADVQASDISQKKKIQYVLKVTLRRLFSAPWKHH